MCPLFLLPAARDFLIGLTQLMAEFYNGRARQKAELMSQQEACKDLNHIT